ncbi:MAG: Rpn family recombination-promoting nuclease/putative transposase [Clostridia bacterium]|nr:Rpn family recombination-promoting nuclease/putative transposase [Clostridia bacterium]
MERLKPTNDFLFKKLFGESKNADLLKDLLQAILTDIKIKKVQINKDVSLERKLISEKLGILDIVATLNDSTRVNIEMQVKDYYNTIDRSVFYGTGIYHENLNRGQDYLEMPKSISIWITDYDVFEEGPFHERARLKRDYENIVLTDKLEIHYIQLTKFKEKCKRISSKLEQWLTFIKNENVEEIRMIDNKLVQKAEDEFEYLTGDAETRRLAELREKAIRDEAAGLKSARRKGIEEGIQQGIEKGIEKEKIATAKKMLAEKIDIELIMKITELTKEEIEKLK